jgi:hypothetical protein
MPFEKGNSGNPNGRPRGNTSSLIIKEALAAVFEDGESGLIKNICESAKAGDIQAATILINRLYPALKPVQEVTPFTLAGDNPAEQAQSVLAAVAGGQIPVEIGVQLIAAISQTLQIMEVTELAERLEQIERTLQKHTR